MPEIATEPGRSRRYYFHHRSKAELIRDDEGACFASAGDALNEAIRCAREIICEKLLTNDAVDWASAFEIEDEDGNLSTVSFREAVGLPKR